MRPLPAALLTLLLLLAPIGAGAQLESLWIFDEDPSDTGDLLDDVWSYVPRGVGAPYYLSLGGSNFIDGRDIEMEGNVLTFLDDDPGALADDVWQIDLSSEFYFSLPTSSFNDPRDVEIGPDGKVWILDQDADPTENDIWFYDFGTELYTSLSGSNFDDPRDIEFADDGSLWILDGAAGLAPDVYRYDFGLDQFDFLVGSDFNDPRAIHFGPTGELWILDQDGLAANSDLWRYDFNIITYSTVPGSQFDDPRDVDFDDGGNLWLVDEAASSASEDVFERDGVLTFAAFVALGGSTFVDPRGLAAVPGAGVPALARPLAALLAGLMVVSGCWALRGRRA